MNWTNSRNHCEKILFQNTTGAAVVDVNDRVLFTWNLSNPVEIKCQLDATEVFIADLTACSTCFGHHYAHHQELKSIIQWLQDAAASCKPDT